MYTIDPTQDEPIMLLNKQIGMSYNEYGEWDGVPYIDGAEFQQELMYLDTLGKKSILVKINSEGGSVIEGMKIFDAILTTKTPVDTYNGGIAASIAGAIFMAGRKRYMADYANFMCHPVSGDVNDKTKLAFTDSIVNMIQSKCNLKPHNVSAMMEATTWINSDMCEEYGICTEIVTTEDKNKKYMPTDAKDMLAYCNKIIHKTLKTNNMELKQITNKLNLVEGADVSVINNAIDQLIQAKNQAETNVTELQANLDAANAELQAAQEKLNAAQAELDAAKAETEAAKEEAATLEATEAVNKFSSRIGNDPEVLSTWVNLYKANKETTTKMLEAIPLNRVANQANVENPATQKTSMEAVMMQIKAKQSKN